MRLRHDFQGKISTIPIIINKILWSVPLPPIINKILWSVPLPIAVSL